MLPASLSKSSMESWRRELRSKMFRNVTWEHQASDRSGGAASSTEESSEFTKKLQLHQNYDITADTTLEPISASRPGGLSRPSEDYFNTEDDVPNPRLVISSHEGLRGKVSCGYIRDILSISLSSYPLRQCADASEGARVNAWLR